MTRQDNKKVDIAIVGAGIGGAAAAVALQQAGFTVDVYEKAKELREVGGAIVIRKPSVALFSQWGLEKEFERQAVAVNKMELRSGDGALQGTTPVSFDPAEGEWAYSVHRADVHSMLVSKIPPERLHLDHQVEKVTTSDGFAEAEFTNGTRVGASILIGADGLRSVTRSLMDATEMKFVGQVTHRTVVPASVLPGEMRNDCIRIWRSDKRVVIFLPVHDGRDFAVDAVVWQPDPPEELWSSVSVDTLLTTYADFDPLIARALNARSVAVTSHPVYDKAPLATWVSGRVVLLGDAAHPMAPMQGQGANSAIQDAGALVAALLKETRVENALHAYQQERAPVTAEIQARSRVIPTPKLTPA